MTKSISVIIIIVQIWITLHFVACAPNPYSLHGAPIIESAGPHIVIDVDTDKKIECKADKPVTWISEIERDSDSNVSINNDEEDGADELKYRSYLDFTSINTDHVGRYYCIYKYYVDEGKTNYDEEVKKFKASTTYVFVNDPDKLLVEPKEIMIMARQFEPFIIPCKPTTPDVRVELKNEQDEVTEVPFEFSRGFTVTFYETVYTEIMTCRAWLEMEGEIVNETSHGFMITVEKPLEDYIPTPELTSDSKFYAINGNNVTLTCDVTLDSHTMFVLAFEYGGKRVVSDDNHFVTEMQHDHHNRLKAHINLTIINVDQSRDEGDYKCIVMDHYNNKNSNTKTLTFVDEPVVTFKPENPEIKLSKGKKQARFLINYKAYPEATIYIFNPKNEQISADHDVMKREKYDVKIGEEEIRLSLKHPDVHDYGTYTILASSAGKNFTTTVKLTVSERPTVYIEDAYVLANEPVNMICRVIAYPVATVSWGFIPCTDLSKWPGCGHPKPFNSKVEKYRMDDGSSSSSKIYDDVDNSIAISSESLSEITQEAPINFTPTQPGHVICRAQNTLGVSMAAGSVKIGDMEEPFMISGLAEDHQVAEGDSVRLECGAIIYNHSERIIWRKDDIEVEDIAGIHVDQVTTKYSYRKIVTWRSIGKKDNGVYTCEVHRRDTDEYAGARTISIEVFDAKAPQIISNFNQSIIRQPMGDLCVLNCFVNGLPTPIVTWYKNDEIFKIEEDENSIRQDIMMSPDNASITFNFLKMEDSGVYRCRAENRIAAAQREVELAVDAITNPVDTGIFIGIIAAFVIFICILAILCIKVRKDRHKIAELKAAGLANFEEGNLESIDPDANLDEQADLLPYNRDVEFPREKLKLGKQLGAGAFGVVVKAIATGIVPYEEESTVAVKMVKKQTDNDVMKALVSELKIMIHLGQHLNVVNLLGAVTKNIAKRELMVIVEYCQFGNLQQFLVKHRPYFIDQIREDKIDQSVWKNDFRWSDNSAYQINSQGLKYIELVFPEKDNRTKSIKKHHNYINVDDNHYINVISDPTNYPPGRPGGQGLVNQGSHMNSKGYVRHSGFQRTSGATQIDSCNTEATILTNGEDAMMLSNNSEQPLWRTSYGMDYKGPARTVCTSDLVCWAFQIARGMDYLSSRKVLHGDLAARNVLLCDNNVVKICDFGLARNLYKSENYKKKTETPLPFKWLALESISDHNFSVYSDVWAFGIVMWELFTLGKVPYTGMEANETLFYKIRDGYRMEKPTYSTTDIYYIMLSCWNTKPETRPLFNELEKRLGRFLHDSVKDHYIDLNEPYMSSNLDYLKSRPDYLTQFSAPAAEAPKPPLAEEENFYVNEPMLPENNLPATPSYLAMSPKSGTVRYRTADQLELPKASSKEDLSPTLARNLDSSPKRKYESKVPIPEEIPMLRTSRDSNDVDAGESDDDHQNGYTEMSFSNPHPKPPRRSVPAASEYINVIKSNENYVNVPTNNATISNPAYITINTPDEK